MDTVEFFLQHHARVHSAEVAPSEGGSLADNYLAELTDEQIKLRPGGLNSIAWLLWHMARAEDLGVNAVVLGEPQVLDDVWARRLRVDRRDLGTGMTDVEVTNLSEAIDIPTVRAYRNAVGKRVRDRLGSLRQARWAELIGPPDVERATSAGGFGPNAAGLAKAWLGRSRGGLLGSLAITHNAIHLGELATVKSQVRHHR